MKMKALTLLALSLGLTSFNVKSYDELFLIDHLKKSILAGENHSSRLNSDILALRGYSTDKVRHFLNNVCSLPGAHYLEIGVFMGSTFISALYNNLDTLASAIAIDDWTDGTKKEFQTNTAKFLPANAFSFYAQNCFRVNKTQTFTAPIDIYFYDGDHSFDSHLKAFTYFNDVFANVFIAIVDEWNWEAVRAGTRQAFKDLNYTVLFEQELPARYIRDLENWWNGLYVAVIKKPSSF